MAYDSQGNFTRLHNWEQDRKNDVEIMSDRHDEEDDNFAEGLNECLLRDGRVALSGNINMGNYQIKNMARGTADNDSVNLAQVTEIKENVLQEMNNAISALYYIGDIKASVQSANHGVWLLCDGQAVSRTEYADLFNLIGISFGSGDGVATFNIPDYRGKFLRGLGGDSAADIHTTQSEGLPNLTGYFDLSDDRNVKADGSLFQDGGSIDNYNCEDAGGNGHRINFNAGAQNAIYGASNHVTPINMAVNYFIKAKG